MSLLPALTKTAAAKLERAQNELAKAEATRGELQAKLASLDVEGDGYQAEAAMLNAQISVQIQAVNILALQVAGLENKVAQEQERERERRRQLAIRKAETQLLPQYLAAVEEHAAALLGPRTTRAKLLEARKRIITGWPVNDLEMPFAFYLDVARADRALQAIIDVDDATAKEIAKDFVAHEVRMLADLLASLKSPQPKSDEEIAA